MYLIAYMIWSVNWSSPLPWLHIFLPPIKFIFCSLWMPWPEHLEVFCLPFPFQFQPLALASFSLSLCCLGLSTFKSVFPLLFSFSLPWSEHLEVLCLPSPFQFQPTLAWASCSLLSSLSFSVTWLPWPRLPFLVLRQTVAWLPWSQLPFAVLRPLSLGCLSLGFFLPYWGRLPWPRLPFAILRPTALALASFCRTESNWHLAQLFFRIAYDILYYIYIIKPSMITPTYLLTLILSSSASCYSRTLNDCFHSLLRFITKITKNFLMYGHKQLRITTISTTYSVTFLHKVCFK